MKNLVFFLLFFIFSCTSSDIYDTNFISPESLKAKRDYNQFIEIMINDNPNLNIMKLGTVHYSNYSFDIFNFFTRKLNTKKVLIVGCCHGDERSGSYAIERLLPWFIKQNISFDIIPVLNPYGWERGYRYNGEGKNINRDFNIFKTQEASILGEFLSNKKYDLVLDLHEAWSRGYFIYSYSKENHKKAVKAISILKAENYDVDIKYRNMISAKNGVVRVKTNSPFYRYQPLAYYAQKYLTNESYTLEAQKGINLKTREDSQILVVKNFIENL